MRPELGGRVLSGWGWVPGVQRAGSGVAARNQPENDAHQGDRCQTEEQKDPGRQFGFGWKLHNPDCMEVILYGQVGLAVTAGTTSTGS